MSPLWLDLIATIIKSRDMVTSFDDGARLMQNLAAAGDDFGWTGMGL